MIKISAGRYLVPHSGTVRRPAVQALWAS